MTTPNRVTGRARLGSPVTLARPSSEDDYWQELRLLLMAQQRTAYALKQAYSRALIHHLQGRTSITKARALASVDTAELAEEAWRASVEARVAVLMLTHHDHQPSDDLDSDEGGEPW